MRELQTECYIALLLSDTWIFDCTATHQRHRSWSIYKLEDSKENLARMNYISNPIILDWLGCMFWVTLSDRLWKFYQRARTFSIVKNLILGKSDAYFIFHKGLEELRMNNENVLDTKTYIYWTIKKKLIKLPKITNQTNIVMTKASSLYFLLGGSRAGVWLFLRFYIQYRIEFA